MRCLSRWDGNITDIFVTDCVKIMTSGVASKENFVKLIFRFQWKLTAYLQSAHLSQRAQHLAISWRHLLYFPCKQCNNGLQASNESLPWDERFQALCRSRPRMAVKIIRIWDFSDLLHFIKQGIKIIQLVRDPRRLFMSQTSMGVNQLGPDCNGFLNDLKYVRNLYKRHNELVRK